MTKMLFGILISINVYANESIQGGVDGGGGKSVVCRNSDGSIKSAELLDIFEGRVMDKLTIPSIKKDYFLLGLEMVEKLSKGRGENFLKTLKSSFAFADVRKNILPEGVTLEPTDDSYHIILPDPKSCKVEQLAIYQQDSLYINGDIWKVLDDTNKAALMLHEGLYKIFRSFGEKNSIRTRKHVARVFAGVEPTAVWSDKAAEKYLICETSIDQKAELAKRSRFYVFPTNDNSYLRIAIDMLDGQLMLSTTSVAIDKITLEQFLSMKNSTYWLHLYSYFDMLMPFSLSFQNKTENRENTYKIKVGMESMPGMPQNEVKCRYNQ